jgi:hypothetical protein
MGQGWSLTRKPLTHVPIRFMRHDQQAIDKQNDYDMLLSFFWAPR